MDYENKFNELKANLEAAMEEAIWVPNELLPERYQDNREGGSTIKRMNKIYDAEILPNIEFQQMQAEKAERLEKYAAEYDEHGTITYDVNEHRQYNNEQSFCDGLLAAGIVEADDFLEEI
jgi:hypothetical protein